MQNTIEAFTDLSSSIDDMDKKCQEMEYRRQRFIEWYATKDLVYWDNQEMKTTKQRSASQLARDLNISRQTLYNWPKIIPDFSNRIEHIKSAVLQTNLSSVWNTVYLQAIDGNLEAIRFYLNTFDPAFRDFASRKRNDPHHSPCGCPRAHYDRRTTSDVTEATNSHG
jgi:hypothetical protein